MAGTAPNRSVFGSRQECEHAFFHLHEEGVRAWRAEDQVNAEIREWVRFNQAKLLTDFIGLLTFTCEAALLGVASLLQALRVLKKKRLALGPQFPHAS